MGIRLAVAGGLTVALVATTSASAAVPHTVAPGETLWSIAAANNLTTRTVAAYNGVSEDAHVVAGQTIEVPTVDEGVAPLAAEPATAQPAGGSQPGSTEASVPPAGIPSAPGMGHIPSPWGELHLAPAAAEAWNAMHQESLRAYGIDLVPEGPMSAYRTYDQQAELHELYLSGAGAPANSPGSSSHELGTAVDVGTPQMRWVIDQIGASYGWGKVHAPGEWWHVDYVGG
ncbi:MAG TPA: LysM peptidoglycan-binding domain-containing protein [Solirubrobacterales bacterium]|nr:LysM peptidoglycan-binding domain-containing protein [Solirubrobacterales bacterium]